MRSSGALFRQIQQAMIHSEQNIEYNISTIKRQQMLHIYNYYNCICFHTEIERVYDPSIRSKRMHADEEVLVVDLVPGDVQPSALAPRLWLIIIFQRSQMIPGDF